MATKRRASLAPLSSQPPMKRPRSELAMTQEIVRRELKKQGDLKYADSTGASVNMTATGTFTSVFTNLVRGQNGINGFDGNTITPNGYTLNY